jgi:hypothetical protein
MKKAIYWILASTAVLLLALSILWFFPNRWGYGGMMGGYGMMGGNYGFVNPLGWLGMAFGMTLMWLIPAGILFVIVAGAVALVNNLTRPSNPSPGANLPVSSRVCQACGKPAQADWNTCPYCGQTIS